METKIDLADLKHLEVLDQVLKFEHVSHVAVDCDAASSSTGRRYSVTVWCTHGHAIVTGYGPDLVTAIHRVRNHFDENPDHLHSFGVSCGGHGGHWGRARTGF